MKKTLGGDGFNIVPSHLPFYPWGVMDVSDEHASVVAVNPCSFLSSYDDLLTGLAIAS